MTGDEGCIGLADRDGLDESEISVALGCGLVQVLTLMPYLAQPRTDMQLTGFYVDLRRGFHKRGRYDRLTLHPLGEVIATESEPFSIPNMLMYHKRYAPRKPPSHQNWTVALHDPAESGGS